MGLEGGEGGVPHHKPPFIHNIYSEGRDLTFAGLCRRSAFKKPLEGVEMGNRVIGRQSSRVPFWSKEVRLDFMRLQHNPPHLNYNKSFKPLPVSLERFSYRFVVLDLILFEFLQF